MLMKNQVLIEHSCVQSCAHTFFIALNSGDFSANNHYLASKYIASKIRK